MPIRTLIVEDTAPAQQALALRLEAAGCQIVGRAGNASEGLRLFRELKPALVTLDLVMPQIEGITAKSLFYTIRKEAPNVAVLVISAQAQKREQGDFLRAGALAYFQKPFFDPKVLREKLGRAFPELAGDLRLDNGSRRS